MATLVFPFTFIILSYLINYAKCLGKISPELKTRLGKDGKANILVTFDGAQDICQLGGTKTKSVPDEHRSTFLTKMKIQLETKMASSQAGVLGLLKVRSATKFTQFWIINSLLIEDADAALIQSIAEDSKVSWIMEEPIAEPIEMKMSETSKPADEPKPSGEPQPNLKMIKVPETWELLGGQKGDGIRIGIIDSGVHHSHEALWDSWLGQYGWYDPGGRLGNSKPTPYDDRGQGTLVAGFITGAKGLGVAPNSKWMACKWSRNDDLVNFRFQDIVACAQWMSCPTLADGSNPDCSKAPHIINNSWGFRYRDVNSGDGDLSMNKTVMDALLDCWHAAGIIPVQSVGNDGPACATGKYPGDNPKVITVGAVNMEGQVMDYSSRGPANETAGGGVKPDVCAPSEGLLTTSNTGDDKYRVMERGGTGAAAPHVAGAIALLLNKHGNLNFDQVKAMIQQSTEQVAQTSQKYENCGDKPMDKFPNNLAGYGVVNVRKLLQTSPPAL